MRHIPCAMFEEIAQGMFASRAGKQYMPMER